MGGGAVRQQSGKQLMAAEFAQLHNNQLSWEERHNQASHVLYGFGMKSGLLPIRLGNLMWVLGLIFSKQ